MLPPHGRGVEAHGNCLSRPKAGRKRENRDEEEEEGEIPAPAHPGFFLQGWRAAGEGGDAGAIKHKSIYNRGPHRSALFLMENPRAGGRE